MKSSERRRRLTAATSVIGAALGGAVGEGFGGMFGATLGAAAGVVLPWGFDALPILIDRTPVVGHTARQLAIAKEVRRKLQLEFGAAAPADPGAALELLQEEARAIDLTQDFDMPGTLRMVAPPAGLPSTDSSGDRDVDILQKGSPIRVICPSICPSIVSVCKSLALQLHEAEIELQLDFFSKNSGEITRRYASEKRWDFCVMCRLAIPATDKRVDEMLLQVAPIFSVSQYMLCRPVLRRDRQARRVLVVRDSPSEAQYWLQQDVHGSAAVDYIDQDQILLIAKTLRDDEYLILWEPLATWLEKEHDLQVLRETKFIFLISLLVSTDWVDQHGAERVHAFYRLFRQHWSAGEQNRRMMARFLIRDPAYLKAFGSAMGMPAI